MDRNDVATRLRQGDIDAAITIARQLVLEDPHCDDTLGLLGVALEASGKIEEAEACLRSAINLSKTSVMAVRHASNLALLLHDAGRIDDLRALADTSWHWSLAQGATAADVQPTINFAMTMGSCDHYEGAVNLLTQVVTSGLQTWDVVRKLAIALCSLGRYAEARDLLHHQSANFATEREFLAVSAYVETEADNEDQASSLQTKYIKSNPVYLAPTNPQSQIRIVTINPEPSGNALLQPWYHQHFAFNYVSELPERLGIEFVCDAVFSIADVEAIDQFNRDLPMICINNATNAEHLRTNDHYIQIERLEKAISAAVVNPARNAILCTRQANGARLAGISNLIVPKIKRFSGEKTQIDATVAAVEQSFTYPFIARSVYDQNGANTFLVSSRDEFKQSIVSIAAAQFYVIEFMSQPHSDGIYRRVRAAFVGGKPFVIKADYRHHWNVHGLRAQPEKSIYVHRKDLLKDGNDIVMRPDIRLGPQALSTLQQIGAAMPLDIFGLDFDVDREGRIIFFEANATMQLFGALHGEYSYPSEPYDQLTDAMKRYFRKYIAR